MNMDFVAGILGFVGLAIAIVTLGVAMTAADRGVSFMRQLGRALRWASGRAGKPGVIGRACARAACREVNPWKAQYCRRCGRTMEGAREVKAMRV